MISANRFYLKTCRICGECKGVYTNLMEEKNQPYLNQIHELLPIKIEKSDSLPKNMCHSCIAILAEFDYIRSKCKTVEEKLISTAEKLKSKEENANKLSIKKNTNGKSTVEILEKPSVSRQKPDNEFHGETTKSVAIELENNSYITSLNPDNWDVTCIAGSNTMLYTCKRCASIFVSEKAMAYHVCPIRDEIKDETVPVEPTNTDNETADDSNSNSCERKPKKIRKTKVRRKRIIHECSND